MDKYKLFHLPALHFYLPISARRTCIQSTSDKDYTKQARTRNNDRPWHTMLIIPIIKNNILKQRTRFVLKATVCPAVCMHFANTMHFLHFCNIGGQSISHVCKSEVILDVINFYLSSSALFFIVFL